MTYFDRFTSQKARRLFAALCCLAFAAGFVPLLVMARYVHPYYDDFGFSAPVRQAWVQSRSLSDLWQAVMHNCSVIRSGWQGTYTGTFLTNLQPGIFSEKLYGFSSLFLMITFVLAFGFLMSTLLRQAGVDRTGRLTLISLLLFLIIQCMPDTAEAFFWFNGGVGNTFIYSCLAVSIALSLRLPKARSTAGKIVLFMLLLLLMVVLGGGSYSGGLFGLCLYALYTFLLMIRRRREWLPMLILTGVFLACFLYSTSAFGNNVRALQLGWYAAPLPTVLKALYYGTALIGSYVTLPVIGISVIAAPILYRAAASARFSFRCPLLVALLAMGLFCSQLVPPLYGGVFIGGGRTVDTYWECFVILWFVMEFYVLGWLSRKQTEKHYPDFIRPLAAILGVCILLTGCMGFRTDENALYGIQNLRGMQAALSIVTGQAKRYHAVMSEREAILNSDEKNITLPPVQDVPSVFMPDGLAENAEYDARPALCQYYGKESISVGK